MDDSHIEAEAKWPHFTVDIFKSIFVNENVLISIGTSRKFVPNVPIVYNPALGQTMFWRRTGDNLK